jgi:nucleotide-binding universal stress UspA family protein
VNLSFKGFVMSDIKTILLHLDDSNAKRRVELAQLVAQRLDAQVNAVYCVTPSLLRYPLAVPSATSVSTLMLALDKEFKDKAKASFDSAAADSSRLHWCEWEGNAPWNFARFALYTDLLILGQRDPDADTADGLPDSFVPDMLEGSGHPALVVPYAGNFETVGSRVLLAWNESPEAARALSAALPFMRRASQVDVTYFADLPEAALASIQRFLGAHGIKPALHRGGPEGSDTGELLLSQAADLDSDLLVMGCYGHSRVREWVLGGVTRTILKSMTLPVLMVH